MGGKPGIFFGDTILRWWGVPSLQKNSAKYHFKGSLLCCAFNQIQTFSEGAEGLKRCLGWRCSSEPSRPRSQRRGGLPPPLSWCARSSSSSSTISSSSKSSLSIQTLSLLLSSSYYHHQDHIYLDIRPAGLVFVSFKSSFDSRCLNISVASFRSLPSPPLKSVEMFRSKFWSCWFDFCQNWI